MAKISSWPTGVFFAAVLIACGQCILFGQKPLKNSQTTRFPASSGVPAPPNPAETSGDDDQSEGTSEPSNLVIKKNVRQVIVDVLVTDANGKPVHGLTQKDFLVSEDGAAQRLLDFEAHSLEAGTEVPKLPLLSPDTFINLPQVPERGPLYVLLLDLVNTEMEDQVTARQQLLQFIKEKPAGTRFCVLILAAGLHLIQGFTDDKDLLYAALDPEKPKAHVPGYFFIAVTMDVAIQP